MKTNRVVALLAAVAMAALCPLVLTPSAGALEEAVAAGNVEGEITASGRSTGETIPITVRRNAGERGESQAAFRTWTDTTGKYTVEAKFVGLRDGEVRLQKRNGATIRIAVERLSKADQAYVQERGADLSAEDVGPRVAAGRERAGSIVAGFGSLRVTEVSINATGTSIQEDKQVFEEVRAMQTLGQLVRWLWRHPRRLPAEARVVAPFPKAQLYGRLGNASAGKEEGRIRQVRWLGYEGIAFGIDGQDQCVAIRITSLKDADPTLRMVWFLNPNADKDARYEVRPRPGGGVLRAHLRPAKPVSVEAVTKHFGYVDKVLENQPRQFIDLKGGIQRTSEVKGRLLVYTPLELVLELELMVDENGRVKYFWITGKALKSKLEEGNPERRIRVRKRGP